MENSNFRHQFLSSILTILVILSLAACNKSVSTADVANPSVQPPVPLTNSDIDSASTIKKANPKIEIES